MFKDYTITMALFCPPASNILLALISFIEASFPYSTRCNAHSNGFNESVQAWFFALIATVFSVLGEFLAI